MDEHEERRIANLILERARNDVVFKEKVLELSTIDDQNMWDYNARDLNYKFMPLACQIASDVGLLVDFKQSDLSEPIELLMNIANQLAYLVQLQPRLSPSPIFKAPIGYVFLSWTVSSPRERDCMIGIKKALDWLNVDYFDFNENERFFDMRNSEIKQLIINKVARSQVSIEVLSTGAIRPMIQFERYRINKADNIKHRIIICLELERAYLFQMPEEQESRCTRIDMSEGHSAVCSTKALDQWFSQAGDTSYFKTPTYLFKCYEIASRVRKFTRKLCKLSFFCNQKEAFDQLRCHDASHFVSFCHQQWEVETQLTAIRDNHDCRPARLDDLIFIVPAIWSYRKKHTGHWLFNPFGDDQSVFIRVRFFNVRRQGMCTSSELMHEIETKAHERHWKLTTKNKRKIAEKVEAVDVVTEARNGVSRRFINFFYNGLEYFIEIKADTPQFLNNAKPLFDAWIESFRLRQPDYVQY